MAFFVEFVDPVVEYLERIDGLTDQDRAVISDEIIDELSRDAERFLGQFPLAHESLCFRYDYARTTEHAMFQFDFVVDASSLEMGVVRVVYVECTSEPLP